MNWRLFFLLVLSSIFFSAVLADEGDGIPDNCENSRAAYYRPSVFARYEAQNRRLALIDWTSGEDVLLLGSNLDDTLIRGWSLNCQYLAVATGSNESRATVVYDSTTGTRIGEVPDARTVPHTISWGPGEYLVVETRNGAVVWDVPRNLQYHFDTGFHTTLHRNFNHLRWDTEANQLIANLAVGGRMVIDLNTGQLTTANTGSLGELIIGGERFYCNRSFQYGDDSYAHSVDRLYLSFAPEGGVISLKRYRTDEVLATIQANVQAYGVRNLGWSANCRYLAASVLVSGNSWSTPEDERNPVRYETWVWEFESRRLVGIFPDAHEVPHPISWDTAERHLLVQTRFGAYVWNLETDARVLVTDYVEQSCESYYGRCHYHNIPKSFHSVYWDAGRQQLLAVPLNQPDSVLAYDVNTGAEISRYTIAGASRPVSFTTSNDSSLLIAYADERITLWRRETGEQYSFPVDGYGGDIRYWAAISTDNHYLAVMGGRTQLFVYDLSQLSNEMQPGMVHPIDRRFYNYPLYFINGEIMAVSSYQNVRVNVVTGEITGLPPVVDTANQAVTVYAGVEGTSGWIRLRHQSGRNCPVQPHYNAETRQLSLVNMESGERRIIADDLNRIQYLSMSPDCGTMISEIQLLNSSLPYDETPADERRSEYRRHVSVSFWDVATGEQVAHVDEPALYRSGAALIGWSPASDRALFHTITGSYIYEVETRRIVPLLLMGSQTFGGSSRSYWDYERGILILATSIGGHSFNMLTGEEIHRFPYLESSGGTYAGYGYYNAGMSFSQDGRWVFVYGTGQFAAWNLDTLEHVFLPAVTLRDTGAGGDVSPDGRYLILARTGSVRLWDLTNLAETVDERLPIAMYGNDSLGVVSARFLDNTRLEVVTSTSEGNVTTVYELTTGEIVSRD